MGDLQMKEGFRLLTWNINGIRSLGDFSSLINSLEADVICLQETKVTRDMLTDCVALIPGFSSYYSFSRRRTGYSGVATYVRMNATPHQAEEGLCGTLDSPGDRVGGTEALTQTGEFSPEELRELDSEGRCVLTRHSVKDGASLVIINVYCPRADPDRADRATYKLHFYRALDVRAAALRRAGDRVVIVGDVNTSHREIDHCEPYPDFRNTPSRRFLEHFIQSDDSQEGVLNNCDEEEEDEWKTVCIHVKEKQFLDSFRVFHPNRTEAFTCWNTEKNCRSTNYGTRIDYILSSLDLRSHLTHCDIQPDILGSDHCPVVADYSLPLLPANKPPLSATQHFPEFVGNQAKLSRYFSKELPAKRKLTETESVKCIVPEKKNKAEARKITNFFTSKTVKKVAENEITSVTSSDCINSSQEDKTVIQSELTAKQSSARAAWGNLFKPLAPAPVCGGHQEECVRRKVTKKGANTGREFWCCARGEGKAGDPQARCNFFKWVK